uniref:Uncharacterized protein n=1 Tax=Anopheles farauti TaxID=69004 RepID=A0A182QD41_9DIPT
MEVQNQIYLVVAVGGGAITLLLVLTILLAVYVRKTRTLLEDYIGFSADAPYSGEIDRRNNRPRNDNSQHGYPMDVFSHGMGPRGDQTKARNDHMHNARNINSNRHGGPYRNDVEAMGGYLGGGKRGVAAGGGGEKPMKANHSQHKAPRSQASVDDSALELEVANIFDMDELDEEDLSDFNSGPSGHGDPKDGRYMGNGPPDGGGPPGGRPKRPGGPVAAPHQYDRELSGRPGGGNEGRGNRFQNPHAAMKSKGAGGGGGGGGNGMRGDGLKEGKQNQGYYDDRGDMY